LFGAWPGLGPLKNECSPAAAGRLSFETLYEELPMIKTMAASAALALAATAHAGEVYTGIGTHGLMLGYAQPVAPSVTLRGDVASLGSHSTTKTENSIHYDADLKFSRGGVFADWFFAGGWRLTGGVTVNAMKLDLAGRPTNNQITIGDTTYATQEGDRFDAQVKFPKTTPFLGFGYGHQGGTEGRWGFHFDIGASIGRATVSAAASGPTFDGLSPADRATLNANVDKETQELRDGVGKVRAIPQLSLGVNYRF
jgi:hypothetical protein